MLPIRTTIEDVKAICQYLSKKPTGATTAEAKAIVDSSVLDSKKVNAYKFWGLVENQERLKLTELGRETARENGVHLPKSCAQIIHNTPAYMAVIEKAYHGKLESLSATDIATQWHDHFKEASATSSDKILNDQAVCFFQIAQAADLGAMKIGRKGSPTRIEFDAQALLRFMESDAIETTTTSAPDIADTPAKDDIPKIPSVLADAPELGQAIFLAHGKNSKPLEQLKKILDQFKIPYKVAVEEPNLGRPIGTKIRETMQACNCAILIFSADEEFFNKDGGSVWRPSENVVYELGAAGYLYGKRLVIMKEESVEFPSNFKEIGYISFSKDDLSSKTMDIIKELIGFGIVKIST